MRSGTQLLSVVPDGAFEGADEDLVRLLARFSVIELISHGRRDASQPARHGDLGVIAHTPIHDEFIDPALVLR